MLIKAKYWIEILLNPFKIKFSRLLGEECCLRERNRRCVEFLDA